MIPQGRITAIRESYQQRLESLLAVDEGVAEIVRTLEATGKLGRTYIIFTADNGFFHGEHRVQAGKVLVYEPSVRVPLIIRGPGIPRAGRRAQLAANIDLAATIADAARIRPGRAPDGRSLLPMARDRLLFSGRDLLLETPTYSAIHTPTRVYVEHANGEKELYNLQADPHQLTSQHANPAFERSRTELASRLMVLRGCSGATCRQAPELRLFASYRRGARGCARSNVRLAVGGGSARRISQVHFYVRGRLVRRDARRPFTALIPRRLCVGGVHAFRRHARRLSAPHVAAKIARLQLGLRYVRRDGFVEQDRSVAPEGDRRRIAREVVGRRDQMLDESRRPRRQPGASRYLPRPDDGRPRY